MRNVVDVRTRTRVVSSSAALVDSCVSRPEKTRNAEPSVMTISTRMIHAITGEMPLCDSICRYIDVPDIKSVVL